MWVNTIQKALTKSCVHKYQRDLYLLVEKRKCLPWEQAALFEWYLYDVLLNDLPLWKGDVLWGAPLAAQPRKWTAPGKRERAPERHLHGLPTRHLPPPPRLPLQTLDSLQKTQQWESEVKGVEWKRTGRLSFSTCTTVTQSWRLKLEQHYDFTLWARFSDRNESKDLNTYKYSDLN